MILHQFPDLQWLKQQAEENFARKKAWDGQSLPQKGWPNVVLNTNCKQTYRDNIIGPLSLFSNVSGNSLVTVGSKAVKIPEGFYFLSNAGERYTLEIDAPTPVQTFNIHVGEAFAEQVVASFNIQNHDQLSTRASYEVSFQNRLCWQSDHVKNVIGYIHQNPSMSALELEEQLSTLVTILLLEEKQLNASQLQLPVLKKSTREELQKRLLLATDYIFSHLDASIELDTLARITCLSKFHFLRLFKSVYHKTPHQFIMEVRLQKAKPLLKNSLLSISDIAKSIGIRDVSSFSRLFYNRFSIYPSQYRDAVNN